jgi:hypothetical protein
MGKRELLLEVWEDFGDDGQSLPSLLYAGPRGEESRRLLLGPKARLVTTIWAGSHFEAMTTYYRLMGRGEYHTNEPWDHQPYPEEWILEQRMAGLERP